MDKQETYVVARPASGTPTVLEYATLAGHATPHGHKLWSTCLKDAAVCGFYGAELRKRTTTGAYLIPASRAVVLTGVRLE